MVSGSNLGGVDSLGGTSNCKDLSRSCCKNGGSCNLPCSNALVSDIFDSETVDLGDSVLPVSFGPPEEAGFDAASSKCCFLEAWLCAEVAVSLPDSFLSWKLRKG